MMFVTLFLATLNIRTGELVYCNGGHNPPLIIHAGGKVEPLAMTGGMALGVLENFSYRSRKITLSKNDSLFLFTDGVTEAFNRKREQFSDGRLVNVLESLRDRPLAGARRYAQRVLRIPQR